MNIHVYDTGGTVFIDGGIALMLFWVSHKETRLYYAQGERFKMLGVNNINLYHLIYSPF